MPTIGKKFPKSEYNRRLKRVRQAMTARKLDAVLISCPENIYFLSGLDHMGYFAYQMLVVPLEGTPILITRAMERATVESQVPDLIHVEYSDASLPGIELAAQDAAANESFGEDDPWMEPQGMPTLFRIVRFFSSLLILRSIRVGAFPCQCQMLEYLQLFPQNGQPMVRRSYDFSNPPRSFRQTISSRSITLFCGGGSLQAGGRKFNELCARRSL